MKNVPYYEVLVVIPVGPKCRMDFITDTLDSIAFYMKRSYKVILADDSQKGIADEVSKRYPGIDVVKTPRSMGKHCGLYITLSLAFNYAISNYYSKAILRMDTDALITGPDPLGEAIALFAKHPEVAVAGQYPNNYDGSPWDISWPGSEIRRILFSYRFIKHPVAHSILFRQYLKAKHKGYRRGESVFGGVCVYNPEFLQELKAKGFLPNSQLHVLSLEEDHLFSLLAVAHGFKLGDLSSGTHPFACAWLGLPASPEEILEKGKKIVHSTRRWDELNEEEIRSIFRSVRNVPASTVL